METNATVAYWDSIDTTRYVGFTEQVMSDLETVIGNFYNLPKTQAMLAFSEDLSTHLYRSPHAHNFDISSWKPRLLRQLYRTFLTAGFTGSVKDMLMAIAKVIDIAQMYDITAGYSTVKAVNVVGWKYLFDKHATERLSHYNLFDQLQPCQVINSYPGFSFSHFIKENFDAFKDIGYPIDCWNDATWTISLDVIYDLTDANNNSTRDVLTFVFPKGNFILKYFSSTDGYFYQGIMTDTMGVETVLFKMKLLAAPVGYTPIVLVYDNGSLTIRNPLETVTVQYVFSEAPTLLKLHQPLTERGNGIREITYYKEAATKEQQLFFLK